MSVPPQLRAGSGEVYSLSIYPYYVHLESQLDGRDRIFLFFFNFSFLSILYMSSFLGKNLMKLGIICTSFLSLSYMYNSCVLI